MIKDGLFTIIDHKFRQCPVLVAEVSLPDRGVCANSLANFLRQGFGLLPSTSFPKISNTKKDLQKVNLSAVFFLAVQIYVLVCNLVPPSGPPQKGRICQGKKSLGEFCCRNIFCQQMCFSHAPCLSITPIAQIFCRLKDC